MPRMNIGENVEIIRAMIKALPKEEQAAYDARLVKILDTNEYWQTLETESAKATFWAIMDFYRDHNAIPLDPKMAANLYELAKELKHGK